MFRDSKKVGNHRTLVVKAATHDQEVVGLNPGTLYWMDASIASYYIHKKMKIKGSQMGHTKKLLIKKKL